MRRGALAGRAIGAGGQITAPGISCARAASAALSAKRRLRTLETPADGPRVGAPIAEFCAQG